MNYLRPNSICILLVAIFVSTTRADFGYNAATPCSRRCAPANTANILSLCQKPTCGNQSWIDVDYMLVFSDGFQNPGLAAASVAGTPRDQAGILGDPGTSMLGESRLADDVGSGIHIGYGRWLDDCGNTAITGSLHWIGGNETTANYPGNNGQSINRPFFNVAPAVNAPDSELLTSTWRSVTTRPCRFH